MTKGQDIIQRFEAFCPQNLAEDWDHVGLQLGNPDHEVKRVMVTLDVRPEVVQEAIDRQVDFIFAHHPLMFHPAKDLDTRNPQNAMYARLLAAGITVYAAHTNLDSVNGGMNDWLAQQLNLTDLSPLVDRGLDEHTGQAQGMGRVGQLPQAMDAEQLANYCLQKFNLRGMRLITPVDYEGHFLQRVAILGGSGGSFWPQALAKQADAYITGDVSYHVAQDMQANGLVVADVGHHIEAACIDGLYQLLQQFSQENDWQFDLVRTRLNTDPYHYFVGK